MSDIRRSQGRLQDAHERSKTVTRTDEMKVLREQMQADIGAVSKSADAIKKRLAELDRGNEQVGLCCAVLPCLPGCWACIAGEAACRCAPPTAARPARTPPTAVAQAQGLRARQQQRAHADGYHGGSQEEAQGPDGRVPGPAVRCSAAAPTLRDLLLAALVRCHRGAAVTATNRQQPTLPPCPAAATAAGRACRQSTGRLWSGACTR